MQGLTSRLFMASLLASASLAALAQDVPTAPANPSLPSSNASPPRHDHMARHGHDPAQMQQQMASRQAQRLDALKAKLQLKPEQQAAWDSFRSVMQQKSPMAQKAEHESLVNLTTPERVDRMNQHMAQRQDQMRQRGEASKTFYATLSDDQKKIFDQEMTLRRHPRNGSHGPHA